MKKSNKLYLRIDYGVEGKDLDDQGFQEHLTWAKKLANERYFIGGGMVNTKEEKDGMIGCLFEAENRGEAEIIIKNDPLIENGYYRYELYEWDMVIFSDSVFM